MATQLSGSRADAFPFVHPSIADVLKCSRPESLSRPLLAVDTVKIRGWKTTTASAVTSSPTSTEIPPQIKSDLIQLAHECDDFVFVRQGLKSENRVLQKLVQWGSITKAGKQEPARVLLATLVALNLLEAAVRHANGFSTAGRAPLLKVMLQEFEQKEHQRPTTSHSIGAILQTLLLPNAGLNLRNLLWHGFVAWIPRPWMALVVVLVHILERDYPPTGSAAPLEDLSSVANLPCHTQFDPILRRGDKLLQKDFKLIDISWISQGPSSRDYAEWWRLVHSWAEKREYPLCSCILLTCLLEHGLRQVWCQVNNHPEDSLAKPGVFYVTLDGHGQRHQHDVLLHPFVGEESSAVKNALINSVGGATIALLTDLYCSPCGGPNLRASLAHGALDHYLQQEVAGNGFRARSAAKVGSDSPSTDQDQLWDLVRLLLVLMEGIGKRLATYSMSSSGSELDQYRPVFSYTATTCRNLKSAVDELFLLELPCMTGQQKELLQIAANIANLPLEPIQKLAIPIVKLEQRANKLLVRCHHYPPNDNRNWGEDDVFLEHETNQVLASVEAARTLLLEVAEACATFRSFLQEALNQEDTVETSSRRRRQKFRILAAQELALTIYGFAVWTAIVLLEHDLAQNKAVASIVGGTSTDAVDAMDRRVLLQAVKRSRMTVSTVSTFMVANADRSLKAAKEYSQGKAIKVILEQARF
jgi:hypothetical protein